MLKIAALDVQSETIHLDLYRYGASAGVRGKDLIIPGLSGRFSLPRQRDVYRFTLQGYVLGQGETRDDRAESWRVATDALMAVTDFSLDPADIEVGPAAPAQFPDASPYLGLTADRVIVARCISMVSGPVLNHMSYQVWSFEMESVDSPPQWTDAPS